MSPSTDVREKMTEQNIEFQFVKGIDLLCEEGHASRHFFPFNSNMSEIPKKCLIQYAGLYYE